MYNQVNVFFILVLSLFFISCENDDDGIDRDAPEIEILSPVTNYAAVGDTLLFKARITENDQLHDIAAKLTKKSGDNTEDLWNEEKHTHEKVYELSHSYVVQADDASSELVFYVKASDHNNQIATDSKAVSIQ